MVTLLAKRLPCKRTGKVVKRERHYSENGTLLMLLMEVVERMSRESVWSRVRVFLVVQQDEARGEARCWRAAAVSTTTRAIEVVTIFVEE